MALVTAGCHGPEISVTLADVTSLSIAELVGANCRRIRTELGFTQDQLAQYARTQGLKWNAAKVGDFEAGRSEPTLATVVKVGMALERILTFAQIAAPAIKDRVIPRDRQITLADLLHGDGLIALSEEVLIAAADLTDVGRGKPFPLRSYEDTFPQRSGLAEQRLAKTLGVSGAQLADVSSRLWGATFSQERDRRAGADANQQKKGRISRELRAELEKALTHGDD